jgi:hypothetical protein
VAGLVLVCGVAVGILMYFRRDVAVTPQAMVSYLPQGQQTIVYIDVNALRQSGILERLFGSTVGEEPEYKVFVTESGFDYKTDLDSILYSHSQIQQLFLLKGRFDWKMLIKYAFTHGGACVNGFCRVPASKVDHTVSFYPLRSDLMALGVSRDKDAASNIQVHPVSKVKAETPIQPMWMSMPVSVLKSVENMPAGTRQFVKVLDNAEQVVFSLGPQQERYDLAMDVTCKSQEDAVVVRAELESLTGLLQKFIARENQKPSPDDLSSVLTAGKFERAERHVFAHWPIQRSLIFSLSGPVPSGQ